MFVSIKVFYESDKKIGRLSKLGHWRKVSTTVLGSIPTPANKLSHVVVMIRRSEVKEALTSATQRNWRTECLFTRFSLSTLLFCNTQIAINKILHMHVHNYIYFFYLFIYYFIYKANKELH